MKIKLIKELPACEDVDVNKDSLVISRNEGVFFYDKKTFEIKDQIFDFSFREAVLTEDDQYVLQLSIDNTLTLYHIPTKEIVAVIDDFPKADSIDFVFSFSRDKKYLYVLTKPFSVFDDPEIASDRKPCLYRYDFPTLKNRKMLFTEYTDMFYLPFQDAFLFADRDKNVFLWRVGEEKPMKLPYQTSVLTQTKFNEKANKIYLPYEFGLRVLNFNFEGIDKLEYISDTLEDFTSLRIPPFISEMYDVDRQNKTFRKEKALNYEVIPDKYTLAIVMENQFIVSNITSINYLKIFDYQSGDILYSLPLNSIYNSNFDFRMIDEKTLCLFSNDFCYIFELIEE